MLTSLLMTLWIAPAMPQAAPPPAGAETQVRRVVQALADAGKRADRTGVANLLEPDAGIWDDSGPVDIGRLAEPRKPMSETTAPFTEITSVRLLAPNVAIVHAVRSRYGSLIGRKSAPVVLVLRNSQGRWRIASYALLGSFGPPEPGPGVRVADPGR